MKTRHYGLGERQMAYSYFIRCRHRTVRAYRVLRCLNYMVRTTGHANEGNNHALSKQTYRPRVSAIASLLISIVGLFFFFITIIDICTTVAGLALSVQGKKSTRHGTATIDVVLNML